VGNVNAFAPELPPDVAHAIDLKVLLEDAVDLRLQQPFPILKIFEVGHLPRDIGG
jgi:hypothetical protein